jgi:hypothetical protein
MLTQVTFRLDSISMVIYKVRIKVDTNMSLIVLTINKAKKKITSSVPKYKNIILNSLMNPSKNKIQVKHINQCRLLNINHFKI